jgi:hypothetical protein
MSYDEGVLHFQSHCLLFELTRAGAAQLLLLHHFPFSLLAFGAQQGIRFPGARSVLAQMATACAAEVASRR